MAEGAVALTEYEKVKDRLKSEQSASATFMPTRCRSFPRNT
jgi:hypothetical protein